MALLGVAFVELVLAFAALMLAIFYFRNKKDPRYPPGPPALPLIGNLLQFGSKPQQVLLKWAEEYGPIFSVKMGTNDVIVLNDHKLIKDVFQEASASGRTPNPVFLAFANGNYGVVMSEGAHWEQQRRFTLRKLRDFGFAKTAMEGLILEEANSFNRWLENRMDKPISGNRIFNGPVVNALWNIISGERSEWDGPESSRMFKCAEGMINALHKMSTSGLIVAPFLRFIAPEAFGWNAWVNNINKLADIADESVQIHLKELDPNNPQDLIDHYLIEKQNTTDPSSSFYKETGDKNLRAAIPDLFLAGSETTSHTLSWIMLLMAHNPDVQKKLQKELDTVVGQSRQASISDRQNLPYTEALVMEALRRTSIVNSGVPHRMLEDAVISGYFFPKNATIISNVFAVNNNPKVWGDPEVFRPERFLSSDGKKIVKHDAFLPFSIGKRQCLGMSLANDTLFLFTTAIFQKFNIKPDPNDTGNAINEIAPAASILNDPSPFNIIASYR